MTTPIPQSVDTLASGRTSTGPFITVIQNRNPTGNDGINGVYQVGQRWLNSITHTEFFLLTFTSLGAVVQAEWVAISGGVSALETLTGDSGPPVTPDGFNNINVFGAGGIATSGSAHTLTIDGTGILANLTFVADAGTANPLADSITMAGGTGITTSAAGHTVTFNASAAVPLSFVTDSGTAVPAANSLTIHGTGGITTSGAGHTVTINGSGVIGSLTFTADAGTATPSGGNINILGGGVGLTTTASGSTLELTGTLIVSHGGTGDTSFTAYSVICGGTTSTGPLQNVSGVGTATQVLTSNGPGALPTWQPVSSSTVFTITTVNHAMSPYTVLAADQYLAVDSTGGVVSILLPNAPTTGRVIYIKDSKGDSATNNITVTTVGGAVTIDGQTSQIFDSNYISINVIFNGTSYEIF